MSGVARLDVATGQVRTIRIYGEPGRLFGRVHRMAVNSAAEAVRALGSQIPGFEAFLLASKAKGLGYAVFYGKRNLGKADLHDPCGNEDIRIAPIILGSKQGGIFQIVLGVVLVVVGAVLTAYGYGAIGTPLMNMGWAMVIGGVIQLLSPHPKGRSSQDRPDNQASYSFNGPINTQAQGNPVPLLYGELIVGSAVASAGINAVDQAYIPDQTTPPGGSFDGGGGAYTDWNNSELEDFPL